jgi:hypothetical protein
VRRTEAIGVVEVDAYRVSDPVEVAEERRLENGMENAGVVETCSSGAIEVRPGQRPRTLGDLYGQRHQRSDRRIRMAIRDRTRIDHHRPRQRVITDGDTQKLCVSGRSIEALVQA